MRYIAAIMAGVAFAGAIEHKDWKLFVCAGVLFAVACAFTVWGIE